MSEQKVARLTLPFPWVPEQGAPLEELEVQRRPEATLTYLSDGIAQAVELLDPQANIHEIIERAETLPAGTVALVAGDVPLSIRAQLRRNQVSFLDVDGTAELFWPRLRVSASRFTDPQIERRTPAVTLRGAHGRIVQSLLIDHLDGKTPRSAADLAERAEASQAATSRALRKLREHGLIELVDEGRAHRPQVVDMVALADRLRDETAWSPREVVHGYVYARDANERARLISERADRTDVPIAVTGLVAAAAHGVHTTAAPPRLKIWLRCPVSDAALALRKLDIDPVDREEANCVLAIDRSRVGTLDRVRPERSTTSMWTAHPLRVWCDLHTEPRGEDVAAQLWSLLT